MQISRKKVLVTVILPAIAIAAFASVLLASQTVKSEAVQPQTLPSAAQALSARQMFEKGYATDLVIAKIENNLISAKRGETVSIPVVIEHLSNSADSKDVVLTNFHNPFRNFAPSAREGLSDEEFHERARENASVNGEIRMDSFVSVVPSAVTIAPNSSETIEMKVTIPADLPSEMTNKSITVGLVYDIQPESSQIRGVAPSVTIVVVE